MVQMLRYFTSMTSCLNEKLPAAFKSMRVLKYKIALTPAVKACGGSGITPPFIFNFGSRWGEWSALAALHLESDPPVALD
jgi:hypothetical protein